jgi:glycerol kinase
VGYWEDQDEIKNQWEVDRRFTPSMDESLVEKLRAGWGKALDRAMAWEEPEGEKAATA